MTQQELQDIVLRSSSDVLSLRQEIAELMAREKRADAALAALRVRLAKCSALVLVLLLAGCSREIEYRYQYDAFEMAETASVYSGETVVANAKRVSIRSIGGPTVTEIEVEETHFGHGTREAVYKGRLVFRCVTNERFCERTGDAPQYGKRPRDVFHQWPYAHSVGF